MKKLFSLFMLSILLIACSSETPGGGNPIPPETLNINKTLPTISSNMLTGYIDFIPGEVNFGKTKLFKTFLYIYYKDSNKTEVKISRYESEDNNGSVRQNIGSNNFPIDDVDQYLRKGKELSVNVNGAINTDFTEGTCFERFYLDVDYEVPPPVPGAGRTVGRGVIATYTYQGKNTFERIGYLVYDAIMNGQSVTNYYTTSQEGTFCDGKDIAMIT